MDRKSLTDIHPNKAGKNVYDDGNIPQIDLPQNKSNLQPAKEQDKQTQKDNC